MLLGVSAQLTGCVASTAVKSLPLATKGNRFNIIEPGDGLCSKHRKNYGGNAKETRDVLREPESSYLLFLTNFKGFVPSRGRVLEGCGIHSLREAPQNSEKRRKFSRRLGFRVGSLKSEWIAFFRLKGWEKKFSSLSVPITASGFQDSESLVK